MEQADYQWARPYMHNDERILWRGHPEKLHVFEKSEFPLIVFSSIWTGFFLILEVLPMIQNKSFSFGISSIVPVFFFLVGLYLLIGRLIQKAVCLRSASYVVTNYRVLIRIRGSVHVLSKVNLPPMTVVRYADGEGSILFDLDANQYSRKAFALYVDQRNVIHSIPDVDAALHALDAREP